MIDHVSLNVTKLAAARPFYERTLGALGWKVIHEWETGFGMGPEGGGCSFWIRQEGEASAPTHVAFRSHDRAGVRAFHAAALAGGGRDNGAPGIRDEYGPTYYAAFAHDPDGNNVEAVCLAGDA